MKNSLRGLHRMLVLDKIKFPKRMPAFAQPYSLILPAMRLLHRLSYFSSSPVRPFAYPKYSTLHIFQSDENLYIDMPLTSLVSPLVYTETVFALLVYQAPML